MSCTMARRTACSAAVAVALAVAATVLATGRAWAEEFGDPIVLRTPTPEIDRRFGTSVAVDGDALAVGVPYSPEGGVVYVYERSATSAEGWRLMQIVSSVNPGTDERFGSSVFLNGETLVVGAPRENSRAPEAGAAYVFYRDRGGAGGWGRVRTLAPKNLGEYGRSGSWVAASGDRIAVGAPGMEAVYIHRRDQPIRSWWGVQGEVANPKPGYDAGHTQSFGGVLALSGQTLAVGGWEDRKYSPRAAEVYVFDLVEGGTAGGDWEQVAYRAADWPPSGEWEHDWAIRLSLDAGLMLTGGAFEPTCAGRIFERNWRGRNRWGMRTKLGDPAVDLHSTSDVAIRGRTAAIAAEFRPLEPAGYGYGALVFERHVPTRDRWGPVARLFSGEVSEPAGSVAIGPREIVTGHPGAGVVQIFPRAPIVAADFEAGDTAGLSRAKGNVEVVSPGLRETDYALAVTVDGTTKKSLVRARHPHREPSVSLRFDLAVNRVDLAGRGVEVVILQGPGRDLVRLTLEEVAGKYRLGLWAWEQDDGWRDVGTMRMPPMRAVRLGLDWRAASGPGHDNGRVRLIADGLLRLQAGDLDTDLQFVNGLLLGLPKGSRGTLGGAFLLDEIELHR